MAKTRRPLTDRGARAAPHAAARLVLASIEQLRTSHGWQAYLNARRRFPSYCWRNVLLIYTSMQPPSSRRVSRVAGARLLRDQGPHRRSASGRAAHPARSASERGATPAPP